MENCPKGEGQFTLFFPLKNLVIQRGLRERGKRRVVFSLSFFYSSTTLLPPSLPPLNAPLSPFPFPLYLTPLPPQPISAIYSRKQKGRRCPISPFHRPQPLKSATRNPGDAVSRSPTTTRLSQLPPRLIDPRRLQHHPDAVLLHQRLQHPLPLLLALSPLPQLQIPRRYLPVLPALR
jgi:hypothetical protein